MRGKKKDDRHPFNLIPPEKETLLNYMALIKERMRVGERKSCDSCFSKKDAQFNARKDQVHTEHNRERVYEDQLINYLYMFEGNFNLASDTEIKLMIKDFEEKAEKSKCGGKARDEVL